MFSEGAAKVWFFLFVIVLIVAAVAGIGYVNQQTRIQQLESAYDLVKDKSEEYGDQYNSILADYEKAAEQYEKLVVDYTKVVTDYQGVVDKYNKLVIEFNELAKK